MLIATRREAGLNKCETIKKIEESFNNSSSISNLAGFVKLTLPRLVVYRLL